MEDWKQNNEGENDENNEPYEIERLATILAVTCMFLAALYTVFSVLLFLYFGNEEIDENTLDQTTTHSNKPLVTISNDLRTDKFITMEENSTWIAFFRGYTQSEDYALRFAVLVVCTRRCWYRLS